MQIIEDKVYLTTQELAERWKIKPATVAQWRWYGKGPIHNKIGGKVLYDLRDIEALEAKTLRQSTSQKPGDVHDQPRL